MEHLDPKTLRAKLLAANVSKSQASELVSGKRKPSLTLAARLRAEAGIPLDFWIDMSAELNMAASSPEAAGTSTDKAETAVGHANGEKSQ